MAAATSEPVLQGRERRPLVALAFGLGFSQGCGLCFYVASGGFFSDLLDNPKFFIDACAFFYLPPILITLAQLLLDRHFDTLLGIRPVIRFRITFSSLVVALLLGLMGQCADSKPYPGQGKAVFAIGTGLGCFAAVLWGSCCLLFGAVDPRFVPYLVLGQTAAGAYTNLAARLLGFGPDCAAWRARAFFFLAAGTVLLITAAYHISTSCALLERTYQRHEELLALPGPPPQPPRRPCSPGSPQEQPHGGRRCRPWGFPLLCWSMAACQSLAIAMNMSLTPLSNQVARGEYVLQQELVLAKLLADFLGRSLFLLIPRPRRSTGWQLGSVGGQAALIWLVELCRLPLWLSVYLWARGSQLPAFLANKQVLLWAIWLPLISSGALSSSWCFVVAVTAAPEEKKRQTNLLMSFSVYVGFSAGILIALFTG